MCTNTGLVRLVDRIAVETDRNSDSVSVTAPKLTFQLQPICTGTNSVSAETLRRNAETAETVKLARTVTPTVWHI